MSPPTRAQQVRENDGQQAKWRVVPGPDPSAVQQELVTVEKEAYDDMAYHAAQAAAVRTARYVYGGLAALLAAGAGATALASAAPGVVAALAFLSPVVASFQRLVHPESRAAQHHKLRAEYEAIYRRARVFLTTRFDPDKLDDARSELDELVDELDKARRHTPGDLAVATPIGFWRLWRRGRNEHSDPVMQVRDRGPGRAAP